MCVSVCVSVCYSDVCISTEMVLGMHGQNFRVHVAPSARYHMGGMARNRKFKSARSRNHSGRNRHLTVQLSLIVHSYLAPWSSIFFLCPNFRAHNWAAWLLQSQPTNSIQSKTLNTSTTEVHSPWLFRGRLILIFV